MREQSACCEPKTPAPWRCRCCCRYSGSGYKWPYLPRAWPETKWKKWRHSRERTPVPDRCPGWRSARQSGFVRAPRCTGSSATEKRRWWQIRWQGAVAGSPVRPVCRRPSSTTWCPDHWERWPAPPSSQDNSSVLAARTASRPVSQTAPCRPRKWKADRSRNWGSSAVDSQKTICLRAWRQCVRQSSRSWWRR